MRSCGRRATVSWPGPLAAGARKMRFTADMIGESCFGVISLMWLLPGKAQMGCARYHLRTGPCGIGAPFPGVGDNAPHLKRKRLTEWIRNTHLSRAILF